MKQCGMGQLSNLGENVTETLEVMPRHWKVIPSYQQCQRRQDIAAGQHACARHCSTPGRTLADRELHDHLCRTADAR